MTGGAKPPAGEQGAEVVVDVAVIGAGLAGLATATHLARRGHRVTCIEPKRWPRPGVGESLEFSAPQLLAQLGLGADGDEEDDHLYPKSAVRIVSDRDEFTVWPPPSFARPPVWCSRRTFHTDRVQLDHRALCLAVDEGVEILEERATKVDHDEARVTAVRTNRGTRIRARWFIDASGHNCQLLGRALRLEREDLGTRRASYWTRVDEPPAGQATNLYFPDPTGAELAWAWEIPLNPDEISIGVVLSSTELNQQRRQGLGPREIFERQLATIPRLHRILGEHPDNELHSTSYTPYRYRRPVGPNWVLVGDASAMVDPLTSNGVTSALRHADLAARLVSHPGRGGRPNPSQAWAYRSTASAAVAAVDLAIESFLYQPNVRRRLGLRWAVNLYAATGVVTNSLYAKINPATMTRSLACAASLTMSRLWTRVTSRTLPRIVRPARYASRVATSLSHRC